MPWYQYQSIDENGKSVRGEMEAASRHAVIAQLQQAGHTPIRAKEKSPHAVLPALRMPFMGGDRISRKDILLFIRELATLAQAGLPLDHALRYLEKLGNKTAVHRMAMQIHQRVKGGASLSAAMQTQGNTFDAFCLNMIRAGEASGSMDVVLQRLADHLEHTAKMRASVVSALIYPVILVCVSTLTLLLLMGVVVPRFAPLFEDAGQALPLPTQIVLLFAEAIRNWWWLASGCAGVVLWLGSRQLRQPNKKMRWDRWLLSLPVYGELLKKTETARFCRTLSTLLDNGVPLLTAVGIARKGIRNQALGKDAEDAMASLEEGRGLARHLGQTGNFPELAVQLMEIGEQSGDMERMMEKAAQIHERETHDTINRLLTLLEPVLILGLGMVIAAIILSLLLAVLGMNTLVT